MQNWVLTSACLLVLVASACAKSYWGKSTEHPIPKNGTELTPVKNGPVHPAWKTSAVPPKPKKVPEKPKPKKAPEHPIVNMFARTFGSILEESPEGRELLQITKMANEIATVIQHFVLKTLQFAGVSDPEEVAQKFEKEVETVLTTVGSEEFALAMGSATAHLLLRNGILTEANALQKAQNLADEIIGMAKMLNIATLQGKVGSFVLGVQKFLWRNGMMAVEYSEDMVSYFSKYLQSFSTKAGKKNTPKVSKPTIRATKSTTKVKPTFSIAKH